MSKEDCKRGWGRQALGRSRLEKDVMEFYSEWESAIEADMAKKGWAKTWQELEEKFRDFPDDLLPDSVGRALEVYITLQEAREGLNRGPIEAADGAINFTDSLCFYLVEDNKKYQRVMQSKLANTKKKEKQENLYALSLDNAKSLADDNPSWNNVQIAEEIMKEENYKSLSSRELKRRILANFPGRNHRQNRK